MIRFQLIVCKARTYLIMHVLNFDSDVCTLRDSYLGMQSIGVFERTFNVNVWSGHYCSLVASPMCPIGNPEMLSRPTSNFYDGNVIYVVWKDKLV